MIGCDFHVIFGQLNSSVYSHTTHNTGGISRKQKDPGDECERVISVHASDYCLEITPFTHGDSFVFISPLTP